jgi:hypothetical protein
MATIYCYPAEDHAPELWRITPDTVPGRWNLMLAGLTHFEFIAAFGSPGAAALAMATYNTGNPQWDGLPSIMGVGGDPTEYVRLGADQIENWRKREIEA